MSMWPTILVFHICAATIGLLSGYLAIFLRKGSGWHAAAGNVYVVAMLSMSSSAALIATFMHPIMLNVVVALLTFYLVSTAWWAARRRDGGIGLFDVGAFLFIFADAVFAFGSGIKAGGRAGLKDGIPVTIYFVFGSIALLLALSDVRMLVRGGVSGARRIGRHLWRMCLALLIATFSLYPGQAKLFPKWLRATNLLSIPHVLLIGAMFFWLYRVSRRKRIQNDKVIAAKPAAAVVLRVPNAPRVVAHQSS